jgi:hypothetical protein
MDNPEKLKQTKYKAQHTKIRRRVTRATTKTKQILNKLISIYFVMVPTDTPLVYTSYIT